MVPQGLSTLVLVLAIALRVSERRVVRALERAGASSLSSAIVLVPSNPLARWRLARLVAVGAVRRTEAGAIFLDAAAWERYRGWRQRRALQVLAILLPLLALAVWWARR